MRATDSLEEQQREQFHRSVKKRYPTVTGVVAIGSVTSQEMQEANRKRHAEALRVRAVKKRGK